jgi:hypothetical protein
MFNKRSQHIVIYYVDPNTHLGIYDIYYIPKHLESNGGDHRFNQFVRAIWKLNLVE